MTEILKCSSRLVVGLAFVVAGACIGACTVAPDDDAAATGDSLSACSAQAWRAGEWYRKGAIVTYGGSYYVALHGNPGYDPTISTWYWGAFACAGAPPSPTPAPAPAPSGGTGLQSIISRSTFDAMFSSRNAFYTYDGLVAATQTFPAFATTGTTDDRKREVAAFLANVNHETGGLVYVEEIEKSAYCDSSSSCPCAPGKQYYGRGPLQLSWNYNYCAASAAIFGDKEVLRLDPDRVAREASVAWATGLFFWMTSTGAGSQTAHDAIVTGAGFGETIRTINGALECNGGNTSAVQSRIDAYRRFCALLGVDPGANISC